MIQSLNLNVIKPRLIELPKILDKRGNLTFIQDGVGCPFAIKRVFWTFNVPGGSVRGGHAYRTQQELIVAINGAFDVCTRTIAGEEQRFRLERGYIGLFLPPLTWRHMENFSTNGIGLHLSNSVFNAEDYLRDEEEFYKTVK